VLLPARSDVPLVDAAARSYFPELLNAGVRIYAYGPPALHAKTMLVDSDAAIVGSANLDNRSLRLNFEVAAICYGAVPVQRLEGMFTVDLRCAREVTRDGLERESLPQRLFEGAARLLSPML
jgi:cardiolipin synthase